MFHLILTSIPKSLRAQTTRMFIVLAIVFAALWAFTSSLPMDWSARRSFYLTQPVSFGHTSQDGLVSPGGGNVAEIYPLVTVLLIAAAMALVRMIA